MRPHLLLFALLAAGRGLPAAASSASLSEVEEDAPLDTDRKEVVLDVAAVRPAGSYLDSMAVRVVTDLEMGGEQVHSVTDLSFEMDTTVADLPQGSHRIDVTFRNVVFNLFLPGNSLSCDSSRNPGTRASAFERETCQPIYDMVGSSVELVVDDDGHEQPSSALKPADNSQISGSTDQFLSTNRLLNLVASHPVAPGDSWDATRSDPDGESFSGTATLRGYRQYRGREVAVIGIAGTTTVDWEKWSQSHADLASGMGPGMSFGEIAIQATVYYDAQSKFARYSTLNSSFTMHMKSPLDGSDITVPIQETITLTAKESDD